MIKKISEVIAVVGFLFSISAIETSPLLGILGSICLLGMFLCAGEVEEDEVI